MGELPASVHRIHLTPLNNHTFRPGLQGMVASAILRRLLQNSSVRVVPIETAQAVMGGNLTVYENFPIAFDVNDVGRRFRVRVGLSMELKEQGAEKPLLKEDFVGEAYYTTGSDVLGTRSAEEEAAQRAAADLAARVVTRLTGGL